MNDTEHPDVNRYQSDDHEAGIRRVLSPLPTICRTCARKPKRQPIHIEGEAFEIEPEDGLDIVDCARIKAGEVSR